MDTFSGFLPFDRRRALAAGRPLPDRVRGAALFADISGFTALTAALRHELGARRGAEEVVDHVNRVYDHLIAQVLRYHGDIIDFSGDAVTCWFDGPDEPVAAGRAVACALELQAAMAQLQAITTPAGTIIPLQIKVAVAAGPARRFLVGDPGVYVLEVLAGATVDRMAAAEALAERGEVIVSAEVLDLLDPRPPVALWRGAGAERFAVIAGPTAEAVPPPTAEPPAVAADAARPWLLPTVYDTLRQGAADFLAELRPTVSMFIHFTGIDYDHDDDAGHKLDHFVRRAQAILAHYEGFLLQISMGDKGSYLYASFGAPVAHENDPARAAAAALELRELPAALGFLQPLQIGLSRGLAHSGAYGSARRRTYGVMGNQVNISARLMAAAQPGQIRVSSRVAEAIRAEFDFNELPPISLKGIAEPFASAELLGRKIAVARPIVPSVMIGREAERAQLDEALSRLAEGRSTVVLIEGVAGLGKSLLMHDLALKAAAASAAPVVLAGNGDAVERSTSYYAWRPIFERLVGSARGEEVVTLLSPEARPLAPLLNAVLPLDLPETELTASMTGEARQENTQHVLIELLRGCSGGAPLVLLLDDAQWLDSVSWALLGRVAREIEPLLPALAIRAPADDPPPVYTELGGLPIARRIRLDALPPAAVEDLIGRRLGVARLPPDVTRLIHDKAEGHPFFSEELAYALRDAGLLLVADGEARVAPGADLAALDFPTTIQGVITSRIDRLPPPQQLAVKVASVIGRIFAFQIVREIYPVDADQAHLRESLDRLARLDITPQETPEPNLAYIFRHIVTQEVVYSLMTFAQRQQLHDRAARWYEAAGEGARSYPLLAHHWRLAGDAERAIDYYEKAGENAVRDYANEEAIRFFEMAESLAGPDVSPLRRARWRRLRGEAGYRLTRIEGSVADYNAGLAALGRPIPPSAARRGLGIGRELARQATHRLLPTRLVGQAAVDERPALLEASRAYEGVAEIYYNLGDTLASFYCILTSFNLAERAGPSPELMRGYANMCATFGSLGISAPAERYLALALDTGTAIDDPAAVAWSQIPLSNYSLWVGEWERAEAEIAVALDIYSRLGEWRSWCVAAWVWPQVVQSKGELGRARGLWAKLAAVAQRSNDTRHQVRGGGGQFFNHLSLGETEAAFACLDAVNRIMSADPEMVPVEERLWHGMNAVAAVRRGQWGRARELAHEQLAAIGRARFKFDLLEVFAAPAEVLLALQERGEATAQEVAAGGKALDAYARTYAFARPRALRVSGSRAWLAGRRNPARRLWERSAARAAAMDMPYERALTLREIGRRLDDPAAAAEAEATFAALGCDLSALPL